MDSHQIKACLWRANLGVCFQSLLGLPLFFKPPQKVNHLYGSICLEMSLVRGPANSPRDRFDRLPSRSSRSRASTRRCLGCPWCLTSGAWLSRRRCPAAMTSCELGPAARKMVSQAPGMEAKLVDHSLSPFCPRHHPSFLTSVVPSFVPGTNGDGKSGVATHGSANSANWGVKPLSTDPLCVRSRRASPTPSSKPRLLCLLGRGGGGRSARY